MTTNTKENFKASREKNVYRSIVYQQAKNKNEAFEKDFILYSLLLIHWSLLMNKTFPFDPLPEHLACINMSFMLYCLNITNLISLFSQDKVIFKSF